MLIGPTLIARTFRFNLKNKLEINNIGPVTAFSSHPKEFGGEFGCSRPADDFSFERR